MNDPASIAPARVARLPQRRRLRNTGVTEAPHPNKADLVNDNGLYVTLTFGRPAGGKGLILGAIRRGR
jgi:hypothetical protein